ncbi:MAG TPA: AmmeMemoRadiSam system protein B [Candidatus Polarisedimenticolia bacterium]
MDKDGPMIHEAAGAGGGGGTREPAVAGTFYPGDPGLLRSEVEGCLEWRPPGMEAGPRVPATAAALIVPHAGYVYSGRVAGATYASAELSATLVILCPNHTGMGEPIAVMSRGAWRTPLGPARIDEALADRILERCPLAAEDDRAHLREHSLEVQIPFLQVKLDEFSFVPICVGTGKLDALTRLGRDLAEVIREWDVPVGIVISSDMSHYIPAREARDKDMAAVDRVLALDPEGLHRVVHERDITMCGVSPAVAGLTAAKANGASSARLVAYANSGDASGDYDRVVGYAGLLIS